MGKYDKIIGMPHHVSRKHPQMSMYQRAAQFAPFAALTGHGAAINETARLTDSMFEIPEHERNILNKKIAILLDHLNENPFVTLTYFIPDDRKDGGHFTTTRNRVMKFDEYSHTLHLEGANPVQTDRIVDMQSELFADYVED